MYVVDVGVFDYGYLVVLFFGYGEYDRCGIYGGGFCLLVLLVCSEFGWCGYWMDGVEVSFGVVVVVVESGIGELGGVGFGEGYVG